MDPTSGPCEKIVGKRDSPTPGIRETSGLSISIVTEQKGKQQVGQPANQFMNSSEGQHESSAELEGNATIDEVGSSVESDPSNLTYTARLAKRLQARIAATREEVLSEEEREENWQAHVDEVIVLQSIFGDDFHGEEALAQAEQASTLLLEERVPFVFEITVRVDAAERVALQMPGPAQHHPREELGMSVHHLPPLRLTCALPPTCPSRDPPMFSLACVWLSGLQLTRLCKELDALWLEECVGMVSVFTWAEHLKLAAVNALGTPPVVTIFAAEPLANSEQGGLAGVDRAVDTERAFPCDTPFQTTLMGLLRYDEMKVEEEFVSSMHTCLICYTDRLGSEFVRVPSCRHMFCVDCMRTHSSIHVKDGTLDQLRCPDPSCKSALPPNILKEVLDKEAFDRWERLTLERSLDCMTDLVYCPRCDTAVVEDEDHLAECSECHFNFCSLCNANWHPGRECMDAAAKLRILQERGKGKVAGEDQKRRERLLTEEILNMSCIRQTSKQCPVCRTAIEKSEGCNKMTCRNCGTFFCYKCGKQIQGYDHFREGGQCVLFDLDVIQEWDRRMNANAIQIHLHAYIQQANYEDPRGANRLLTLCPNCRQQNIKTNNNNHISCWACTQSFCFLCRKMTKGTSHFSRQGCKQHSV